MSYVNAGLKVGWRGIEGQKYMAYPAAFAASTPEMESSNTMHDFGGIPKHSAAFRYPSGLGLPRQTSRSG